MSDVTIESIMTKKIVTVSPETPLADAAKIMNEHKYNGLPVVTAENVLVGIITEYDFIGGDSNIHLPTLQAVLSKLTVLHKDKQEFKKDIEAVSKLTVKDVMNPDPLTLPVTATFDDVITTFREHHRVNPIPVIDDERKVVGVVSRFDVVKGLSLI